MMTNVSVRYLACIDAGAALPAQEYIVQVTRSDGLPLDFSEVQAALVEGLSQCKQRNINATSSLKKDGVIENEPNEVLNVRQDVYAILAKLKKPELLAWQSALRQLSPSKGEQIVEISDKKAAKILLELKLIENHGGQDEMKNIYVVPRSIAHCTVR
jgi:hypothetical protein